jgi:hypothetical protein
MGIETPLRKLEIIGNTTTSILKANHSNLISKGSREYILSVRETMLDVRSFKVPEDWDTDWNIKLGPIWKPSSLGSNLACWLLPEYIQPVDGTPATVGQANDRSDSGITFENTSSIAESPTFTSALTGANGIEFKGMVFRQVSSSQWLYSDDETGGDEFDVGTGDFAFTFLISWAAITSGTSQRYVLCSDPARGFALSVSKDSSGDGRLNVFFGGGISPDSDITVSSGEFMILTVGRSGGDQFLQSALLDAPDSNVTGTENADISNSQQFFIGSRESGTTDRLGVTGFNGDIYELIFYNGTLSAADRKKIEGYIAHKYVKTALLHADHIYKNNPPRDTTS